MKYEEVTIRSKSIIKRLSHKKRYEITLRLLDIQDEDIILDFGTGDGYLLKLIRDVNKKVQLVGFEPVLGQYEQAKNKLRGRDIYLCQEYKDLEQFAFTKIVCAELFEHLSEAKQMEVLKIFQRLLQKGLILISIPIETGLAAIVKNIVRWRNRQAHGGTSLRGIVYAVFGLKVARHRGNDNYISSHIGFDYRDVIKLIGRQKLRVSRKYYSPIPFLKGILNSQIFLSVPVGASAHES